MSDEQDKRKLKKSRYLLNNLKKAAAKYQMALANTINNLNKPDGMSYDVWTEQLMDKEDASGDAYGYFIDAVDHYKYGVGKWESLP